MEIPREGMTKGEFKMIDKSAIVDDILYAHPATEKIFKDFGIKCFG